MSSVCNYGNGNAGEKLYSGNIRNYTKREVKLNLVDKQIKIEKEQ